MIQRAFYSLEDTRTPFIFTAVQMAFNVAGSLLVSIYVEPVWIVFSLSLVTSGSIVLQAVLAFFMFKKKFGSLGHSHLTIATLKFVIAAVVSGGIGFAILQALGGAHLGAFPVLSVLAAASTCALIGGVMTITYLVILKVLKAEEIETLTKPIRAFLKR